jgi:hypothetical protein
VQLAWVVIYKLRAYDYDKSVIFAYVWQPKLPTLALSNLRYREVTSFFTYYEIAHAKEPAVDISILQKSIEWHFHAQSLTAQLPSEMYVTMVCKTYNEKDSDKDFSNIETRRYLYMLAKQKKNKPHAGVEPATFRLRVWRSTDWASEAWYVWMFA